MLVWQDHPPEGSGEHPLLPVSCFWCRWPSVAFLGLWPHCSISASGFMASPCVSAHRLPSVCLPVSTPLLTRTPHALGWRDPSPHLTWSHCEDPSSKRGRHGTEGETSTALSGTQSLHRTWLTRTGLIRPTGRTAGRAQLGMPPDRVAALLALRGEQDLAGEEAAFQAANQGEQRRDAREQRDR